MTIAHRGFSGRYPENTFVSFEAALKIGCEWVECDVRRTADGVIVVLHDSTVDRTTDGTGAIADLVWDEVRRLDAGSWKGPQFSGARIPSLAELLELMRGKGQVVIELKLSPIHLPEVLDVVREHDAIGWTVASAFAWETILAVRRLAHEWRTTWLTRLADTAPKEAIARCIEAGVPMLGVAAAHTDRPLVEAAHNAGLQVRCWGLGDDRGPELRRLVEIGVDGMTTNHPDVLMAIVKECGGNGK